MSCQGKTTRGKPCRNTTKNNEQFCYLHKDKSATRKGGPIKSSRIPKKSVPIVKSPTRKASSPRGIRKTIDVPEWIKVIADLLTEKKITYEYHLYNGDNYVISYTYRGKKYRIGTSEENVNRSFPSQTPGDEVINILKDNHML